MRRKCNVTLDASLLDTRVRDTNEEFFVRADVRGQCRRARVCVCATTHRGIKSDSKLRECKSQSEPLSITMRNSLGFVEARLSGRGEARSSGSSRARAHTHSRDRDRTSVV